MTWNGAGVWLIFSQSRQENFSRTVSMTFHRRGVISSVCVTSSPSLRRREPPQHAHAVGASITTRSRGRCSGKVLRSGASAGEAGDRRRLRDRLLRGEFVFRGARLQLFEFERQLLDEPRRALRPLPVDLTLQLGDRSFCAAISARSSDAFARATASSAATSRPLSRSAKSAAFSAATSSGRARERDP